MLTFSGSQSKNGCLRQPSAQVGNHVDSVFLFTFHRQLSHCHETNVGAAAAVAGAIREKPQTPGRGQPPRPAHPAMRQRRRAPDIVKPAASHCVASLLIAGATL